MAEVRKMPQLPVYVSPDSKRRLEAMRDGMESALGRRVVMAEVVEALIAEHDKAIEKAIEVESA